MEWERRDRVNIQTNYLRWLICMCKYCSSIKGCSTEHCDLKITTYHVWCEQSLVNSFRRVILFKCFCFTRHPFWNMTIFLMRLGKNMDFYRTKSRWKISSKLHRNLRKFWTNFVQFRSFIIANFVWRKFRWKFFIELTEII